ncbi:hypothetical protein KIPB_009178 [Kipferlia bialata]|uniref:Uncharacterized protein n=1 Tax=Kipferlia bialata TaxID=797122 RepID=A0A9K3D372_9EUKA|nr:hypothetical protein KIPB_009178 [Kipferlia bialata]|eukprot:g9178.t1
MSVTYDGDGLPSLAKPERHWFIDQCDSYGERMQKSPMAKTKTFYGAVITCVFRVVFVVLSVLCTMDLWTGKGLVLGAV